MFVSLNLDYIYFGHLPCHLGYRAATNEERRIYFGSVFSALQAVSLTTKDVINKLLYFFPYAMFYSSRFAHLIGPLKTRHSSVFPVKGQMEFSKRPFEEFGQKHFPQLATEYKIGQQK